MRIVHVHRIAQIGGSERHLLTLLPALAERGLDVVFVGLDVPSERAEPFYGELGKTGVAIERIPSRRDLDVRAVARLRNVLARLRPDVLHTHLVHADAYGALVAGSLLVSTKHNDDPFRAGPFRYVERTLTRRVARVICITESLARFNRDVVGLPAEKLTVVHYGMDAPPFAWGRDGDLELPDGARVLLAIGRLVPQKGLDVAIEALADVRRAEPAAVLVILGDGPERTRLAELAASLGVADAVYLPGHVGDVAWWLERAELLVHPARWEGFGLVLLEAMLARRPVVATCVSAIPEIVIDGETGALVHVDDSGALGDAICTVLADPARARLLGASGYERARACFSVAKMADATIAVYATAMATHER